MDDGSQPQETDDNVLHEIVKQCFWADVWSLLDVVRMSASSKALQEVWHGLLCSKPSSTWLIQAVSDATSSKTDAECRVGTNVVLWLLKQVPSVASAQGVAAKLVNFPSVPRQIAFQLCQLGMRVSYAGIAAAARNHVPGVEVWVEAEYAATGSTCDIPAYAMEICRRKSALTASSAYSLEVFSQKCADVSMQPDELANVLHLALNCSSPRAALAALGALPLMAPGSMRAISQDVGVELLTTALIRHSSADLVDRMLSVMPKLLSMPVSKLLPLVRLAMQPGASLPVSSNCTQLERLCSSIAAFQHITADDLAGLLRPAAAAGDSVSLGLLLRCPAAQHLTAHALAAVLQVAVQNRHHASVNKLALCCQETLDGMPEELRLPLLQTAAQHGDIVSTIALYPRTVSFSTEGMAQLLKAALRGTTDDAWDSQECFRHLYKHPSVANLSSEQVLSLLKDAVCERQQLEVLWGHAAVNRFSADMLADLLHLALRNMSSISTLCQHPAAAFMSPAQILCLLECALAAHDDAGVSTLLKFPAAAYISPDQITFLLHKAGDCCDRLAKLRVTTAGSDADLPAGQQAATRLQLHDSGFKALCCCTAAAGLRADALLHLVEAAMQAGDSKRTTMLLLQCPAAARIPSAMLIRPLQLAASLQSSNSLDMVLQWGLSSRILRNRLPFAHDMHSSSLSTAACQQLLQAVMQHREEVADGSWYLCKTFAEDSPAAGISTAVLLQLMQAALYHRDSSLLHALSCCPAAAWINASVMISLVVAAHNDLGKPSPSFWQHGAAAPMGALARAQEHWKWPDSAAEPAVQQPSDGRVGY